MAENNDGITSVTYSEVGTGSVTRASFGAMCEGCSGAIDDSAKPKGGDLVEAGCSAPVTADPAVARPLDLTGSDSGPSLQCAVTLSASSLLAMNSPQMLYALCEFSLRRASVSADRMPLNLALVVDCSTSMQGARIGYLKAALLDLLDGLQAGDRLSVIAYSDRATVAAESTFVTEKRKLAGAIANLTTGGGTEIYQGLVAGLRQVRRYARDFRRNHVILLTDGRTYGDEEACLAEARTARREDVSISALGIGNDWNDVFLDALARQGGGICRFVKDPSKTSELLALHIRGIAHAPLSEVALSVRLPAWARLQSAFRVEPFLETLELVQGEPYSMGVLDSGTLSLVFELIVQQPVAGDWRFAHLVFEGRIGEEQVSLRRDLGVRMTEGDPMPGTLPARLLSAVARLNVFRLQERAWQKLELGDVVEASWLLESAASRLSEMGESDLAHETMAEARRLESDGVPSLRGQKEIRYGTRFLPLR